MKETRPLSGAASALAAALTAATLLSQEILIGRVLSVVTWYSLGYLALSLGLLGMTVGALAVHLKPQLFEEDRVRSTLSGVLSLCSAFTLVATFWVCHVRIQIDPHRLGRMAWTLVQLSFVFALPFAAGGAALSVLLTRARRPGLVYGADLAGSALGALGAGPVLSLLGGPRALAATALLPAFALVALAVQRRMRFQALALVACIALATLAVPPSGWRLQWLKGNPAWTQATVSERWNSMSYVRALEFETRPPFYWGRLDDAPMTPIVQSHVVIDGEAATSCYAFEDLYRDLDFLRYDLTSAAHWLRPTGPALVIGVGAGRDVAASALYGHRPVEAVEINPLLVDLLQGPMAGVSPIARLPGVSLHLEDGRSWLARQDRRFEVIVAALVDTWASTGAGAMTLTENSLYTREAWDLFLEHLLPDGIVSFSRWYEPSNPLETARLVSLVAEALRRRGIADPGSHMILLAAQRIVTVLASPTPFRPADLAKLHAAQRTGGFLILLAPGEPRPPWLNELLAATDESSLARISARAQVDLSVPTDDRPFFFLQVPLSTWFSPGRIRELLAQGGTFSGNLFAMGTVGAAFVTASLLCLVWVAVPLWRRRGALSGLGRGGRALVLCWFAALGLGFMLFEIATAERLHLLLGNPTWALALTLAPLTLAAGAGAVLSERVDPSRPWQLSVVPGVASLLIGCWALLPTRALISLLSQPFAVRAFASIFIVAVPGSALGFLFPLGLRRVQALAPAGAVWCWGVNGVLSVFGSGAAVFFSVTLGIRATLMVASATYAVTVILAPRLSRLQTTP